MTRATLVLGGAIVLAALVALYVVLRTDDPVQPATAVAASPAPEPVAPPAPAPATPRSVEATGGKLRIARGSSSATAEAQSAALGEPEVRDHRAPARSERRTAAPPPPVALPPIRAETGHQITGTLAEQIRPMLRQCTAGVAADAHGKQARIEGQLFVSITAGQATVSGASFELRDVNDAAQPDDIKQCLTRQVTGLVAPAVGEPDVERYAINLSLSWP